MFFAIIVTWTPGDSCYMRTFKNKYNRAKTKGQRGTSSYLGHFCQMLLMTSRWLEQSSPVESQPSSLHPCSMLCDWALTKLWRQEIYFINSLSAEELFLRPLINNVGHQWSWKTLTSVLYLGWTEQMLTTLLLFLGWRQMFVRLDGKGKSVWTYRSQWKTRTASLYLCGDSICILGSLLVSMWQCHLLRVETRNTLLILVWWCLNSPRMVEKIQVH